MTPARVGWMALFGFAAMLAAGIWLEEPQQIFNKATRICLDCMGIG